MTSHVNVTGDAYGQHLEVAKYTCAGCCLNRYRRVVPTDTETKMASCCSSRWRQVKRNASNLLTEHLDESIDEI